MALTPSNLGPPPTSMNRRVWEHDETLKKYLARVRCRGIDMETTKMAARGNSGSFWFHPSAFIPCFNAPALLGRITAASSHQHLHVGDVLLNLRPT